ncbi:uncharacterized protein BDW70DRAFT_162907 [Aspergillus foveolatus]|uniref:uncharacterized protein n=1 Tax=Aspergillus foveolatus TaxID=210207 RepID=UPI003CCD61CE
MKRPIDVPVLNCVCLSSQKYVFDDARLADFQVLVTPLCLTLAVSIEPSTVVRPQAAKRETMAASPDDGFQGTRQSGLFLYASLPIPFSGLRYSRAEAKWRIAYRVVVD